MEGYPESVKFLHKNTNWNHSAPLLSDIIYVQEQYRTAVENVLEPYLNYYVVNNLEEGLQAVHLLDANKKGKANFFILDKINSATTEWHQPENTFKSLDVIEVDEQYNKLAEYLLANVFIAENDEAIANSNGSVVLEKNGKFVKGKYTLSGGSIGLFEGKKIGRAKNLEKITDEIIVQDAVVNALKKEIQQKHHEVIAFNEQLKESAIRQTQNEINQLTNSVFSVKNKIENLQASQTNAEKRLQEVQLRLTAEHENISSTRESLNGLNLNIQELSAEMKVAEENYQSSEKIYNTASEQYNQNNLQLIRQQNKVGGLQQELVFKQGPVE